MMTLLVFVPEVVIFLNICRSLGIFHGNWLFLPIPPLRVLAMTRSNGIWRILILYDLVKLNS